LVEALYAFENSWEKGAAYFVDGKKWNQLLQFSQVLEAMKEKYPTFANQIDDRDAEIFVSIPWILVLMGIDHEDKGLWYFFCPDLLKEGTESTIVLKELKEALGGIKISENFELYNIIEKAILDIELTDKEKSRLEEEHMKIEVILQKLKWVAMQLSRHDPSEWNLFIDVSLYS
jgi:hypothetical protein